MPRGARIAADIVDNGGHAVSVTAIGVLSGNNSYSGATYANEEQLVFRGESSLPANSDLFISGSEVELDYSSNTPKTLRTIRISEDGTLEAGSSGQNALEFEEFLLESGRIGGVTLVGNGRVLKTSDGTAYLAGSPTSTFSGDVTIEDGHLGASASIASQYTVRGGSLGLFGEGANVELAGGDLLAGASAFSSADYTLNSTIEIMAPSRIVAQGIDQVAAVMSHPLSGTGDLVFTGRGLSQPRSNHTISITRDNPNFSGNVMIDTVAVQLRTEQSLGVGEITVGAGGSLQLAPRQGNFDGAKLDLPNDVYLRGGEVRGFDSVFRPQLLGDLYVTGHSLISVINVVGTTHLADGSRLTTFGGGVLQFLGDIKIGGQTELEYGLTRIVTNASDVDVGVVQLLGTISSDAENAVLNLVDRGLDEIVLDTSFHVFSGQTLQVLQNGQPLGLIIDGSNNTLSGGGTLLNPVEFGDGATISPGDSTGTLSLGSSTTIGESAIYEWEIAASSGLPGTAWDLLHVEGDLFFEATAENPWVLEVIGLPGFDLRRSPPWLIASADRIDGFDLEAVQIDVSGIVGTRPSLTPEQFGLYTQGGNLLIQFVPEPSSWMLAGIGFALPFARLRRRYHLK